MDETHHNIRRTNWLTIITKCPDRLEGIFVKQWLSDDGVKEKAYHSGFGSFAKRFMNRYSNLLRVEITKTYK